MGVAQKGRKEEKPDFSSLERLTTFAAGCASGRDRGKIEPETFPDELKPLASALSALCESSLKEQTEAGELKAIFHENPVAMAIKDRSGRVIEKNPAFDVLMSLHIGSAEGSAGGERTVQGDESNEVFAGRNLVRSIVEIGPEGGELIVAERYGIPVEREGDQVRKALFVYRDLTEERSIVSEFTRLQHKIGELEPLKEGILQDASLPAVLVDHESRVIQGNDAFAGLAGKNVNELAGRTLRDLGFVSLVTGGKSEVTYNPASGTRYLHQYVIPIRYKSHDERYLVIFHDKTPEHEESDRVKAEFEKTKKINEEAVRRLESSSREHETEKTRLIKQIEELKTCMSERGDKAAPAVSNGTVHTARKSGQGSGPVKEKIFDVVEFELGGERYALDIGFAREIVEMMPITPIPRSPPFLRGIMNLRGEITNIININSLLGVKERSEDKGRKIIVLSAEATGGENIGIIVDDVHSVIQVGESEIEQLGEGMASGTDASIKGIIKIDSRAGTEKKGDETRTKDLVIWIDMEKVIRELVGERSIA